MAKKITSLAEIDECIRLGASGTIYGAPLLASSGAKTARRLKRKEKSEVSNKLTRAELEELLDGYNFRVRLMDNPASRSYTFEELRELGLHPASWRATRRLPRGWLRRTSGLGLFDRVLQWLRAKK